MNSDDDRIKERTSKPWWGRPWIKGFSTTSSTLGNIVMFTVAAGTFLMVISWLVRNQRQAIQDKI